MSWDIWATASLSVSLVVCSRKVVSALLKGSWASRSVESWRAKIIRSRRRTRLTKSRQWLVPAFLLGGGDTQYKKAVVRKYLKRRITVASFNKARLQLPFFGSRLIFEFHERMRNAKLKNENSKLKNEKLIRGIFNFSVSLLTF